MKDEINNVDNWYRKNSSKERILVKKAFKIRDLKENLNPNDGGGIALTDLIDLLHEIEYKNKLLNDTTNFIHPKRRANIEARLKYFAEKYFKLIKDFMVATFEHWKASHPIESADEWANMVVRMLTDDGYISLVDYLSRNKTINWGGAEYGIADVEIDKSLVQRDLRDMDDEYLNPFFKDYIAANSLTVKDIPNLIYDERFIDYYIEQLDDESLLGYITEDAIRELIKTRLYRDYLIMWGTTIEQVKQDIKTAIDRMNEVEAKGEGASISEMTMAISLALNVQHANGVIMEDYQGEIGSDTVLGDLSHEYLNYLSERDVTEFETEFHEEFGV